MMRRFCLGLLLVGLLSVQGTREVQAQSKVSDDPKVSATKAEDPKEKSAPQEEKSSGSETASETKPKKSPIEVATFGAGCFWSIEAVFERIPGVQNVVSGYSGGHVANPTYQMVGTGMTGHAEVVQIVYDSRRVTYETLLRLFWKAHDPTTVNAQGDDYGPQYRSMILYHTEEQRLDALRIYAELKAKRASRRPIVTQLVPFQAFFAAEPYHQDYFRNHPDSEYTQIYIRPKLWKLRLK